MSMGDKPRVGPGSLGSSTSKVLGAPYDDADEAAYPNHTMTSNKSETIPNNARV